MKPQIDSRQVRIAADRGHEDGMLLFVNGLLVAIVAHLHHSVSDEFAGRWFVEAGFGLCSNRRDELFDTAEEAKRWVRRCVESSANKEPVTTQDADGVGCASHW
ncbi:hypothetical protein [Methylobacterium oryzisoli]|uniref:hypothetical protein n=1 Tax=Methylobacterium oryzisoli TaxID=3385502 RepID=UPI00389138A9